MTHASNGNDQVVFFIDKAKFVSPTSALTPRTILADYAKENPAETTLVVKDGPTAEKLTDLDAVIHVKDGTKFSVLHNGPTTVS